MADNNAPDVKLDANSNGTVYFAADVVATIAGLAVTEVEGVANTVSGTNGFADIFARRVQGNARNLTRGVKVDVTNNEVNVDVTIIVEYGSPVPEVAGSIQENVKKAIETMTGMNVKRVDVHVAGVSFERENRAVAELEMQQRILLEKKPDQPENNVDDAEATNAETASADTDEIPSHAEATEQTADDCSQKDVCDTAPAQQEHTPDDENPDDDDFVLILEDDPEPEPENATEEKAESENVQEVATSENENS